jgi:hypothetical protein
MVHFLNEQSYHYSLWHITNKLLLLVNFLNKDFATNSNVNITVNRCVTIIIIIIVIVVLIRYFYYYV